MPGKGTTRRSVRVSDDRWKAAKEKAEAEGKTVSDVLNECLDKFVGDEGGKDDRK